MQEIITLGFIFVGVCLALVAVPPEIKSLQIAFEADSYETTTAHVTNQRTQSHGKGPSTEVVEFDYEIAGDTYHGDNHLTQFDDSREDIDGLIRFDRGEKYLEVYYDPDDPERVVVHRDVGIWVPIGVFAVTAACLYAGVGGLLEDRRRSKRAERTPGV